MLCQITNIKKKDSEEAIEVQQGKQTPLSWDATVRNELTTFLLN